MTTFRDDPLGRAVVQAIEIQAAKLTDAAIDQAVETFRGRLREAVGATAVRIAEVYEIERDGTRLIITVKQAPTA